MAADSPAERAHWRSVLKAYDGYMQYHLSANHARRMSFLSLNKGHKAIYERLGYREKLDAVDEGIRRNAEFLDEMISDPVFAEMLAEPESEADDASGNAVDTGSGSGEGEADGGGGNGRDTAELASSSHTSTTTPDHSHDASGPHHSHPHSQSHSHRSSDAHAHTTTPRPREDTAPKATRHEAQDKVRSTLRSFVRDWSALGAAERAACYAPCLGALQEHWAAVSEAENGQGRGMAKGEFRVLVPGCGLGRLAMEVAALGFESQGNEFSTYMLLASNWVLNQTSVANSHTIHPFLHSFSNHLSTANLLRAVPIPDTCPRDVLGSGEGGAFSLVAGDFEEIYGVALEEGESGSRGMEGDNDDDAMSNNQHGHATQRGQWGAVVTCFFIDCARDVLYFLRTIHALLEDGGIWINIGPLLWHFENSTTSGKNGVGSIELSLDEVKELAGIVGFDIRNEEQMRTTYTGIPEGMLRHEYNAAFWTAIKRKP